MASGDQYGPALPPGMDAGNEPASQQSPEKRSLRKQAVIGPCLPPGMQKPADSDDGQAPVKIKSDIEYNIQDEEDDDGGGESQDPRAIGPLPSEMKQEGEDAGLTAEEFERRSKRMKDNLTIKAEAEEGPVKREEWMTELPPEMGKNFGLQSRNFSKGNSLAEESKDRSAWTDTPSGSKEKDSSKGKKRKLEDAKVVSTRDSQLHEQVESYNKSKRSESLLDMHTKKLKKKKGPAVVTSTPADSTQAAAAGTSTTTTTVPAVQNGRVSTQQPQHNIQQYYQLPEEVRDSLDLLSEQKNAEFYGNEYNSGEFNEAKPLADLLINPNMVGYSQEGGSFQAQAQPVYSTSQVIAQAYGNSQQVQAAPVFSQVVSSTNTFPQVLPTQTPSGMSMTAVSSTPGQDPVVVANGQQQTHVVDVHGHQIQAQGVSQAHITTQQAQSYAEAYSAQVVPDSSVIQQQGGQVVTFSLPGGQNMIIASPHTQQAGQNYVIHPQGAHHSQNIVISAPTQQALPGNFIIKTDPDDLGHNIVLTQQNLQQALGQNMLLTQDGHLAHGESIVLTTADGQQRHIQTTRHIQPVPQPQQQVITQGIPIQAGGAHVPQVSLVLPQVNSLFPQIQTPAPSATTNISPEAFLQLCAKMDKMINTVTESQAVLAEMSKKLERIENHLFPQSVTIPTATAIKINKSKPKPIAPGSSTPTTTPVAGAVTKASLKASLSSYLTISDYNASDKLKRSDSNSDLFIPVGTVSMVQGQMMVEAPSPSDTPETASSTVQELPSEQGLIPVVMGSDVSASVRNSDINVPIVDSQSSIAVTVYDEGNEGQKFQLGPGSGKEPTARFSCTNMNPKIVILDPRFWDILVEDFQKNMNSDQIIVAMSSTRKPLVRNIGNSEISICSTILKEAESACQGRRERLAKELVFRIFTLGEVYDRNVSGVFYINGKKMENKNKALDPAKIAAIHYLVMKYPPSVVDNPRLERLVWKNCVDRINDALRRIYNWIHKIVDVTNIMSKLPTDTIMMN